MVQNCLPGSSHTAVIPERIPQGIINDNLRSFRMIVILKITAVYSFGFRIILGNWFPTRGPCTSPLLR